MDSDYRDRSIVQYAIIRRIYRDDVAVLELDTDWGLFSII